MPHAVIDQYYIENLHQLTKNEIIVFAYLLRCRNGKTKQCNPKFRVIAKETGGHIANVSRSVAGLEQKGWIAWTEEGFIISPTITKNERQKVVKSTTTKGGKSTTKTANKSCRNNNSKLANLQLGVVESTTRLNKDIEQTIEQTIEQPSVAIATINRTPHQVLMTYHADRVGTIFNGGGLGRAIKDLLSNYTVDDCIGCYNYLLCDLKTNGGWRDVVDWMTVKKCIGEWCAGGRPKTITRKSYGKRSNSEIADEWYDYSAQEVSADSRSN